MGTHDVLIRLDMARAVVEEAGLALAASKIDVVARSETIPISPPFGLLPSRR